ncbi:MAG: hypothetical protein ABI323_06890 [Solirubrobacteraceae bacterium]
MSHKPPSARQLSYLKALAERTGQTFAYPHTSWQASREIGRLLKQKPSSVLERRIERRDIAAEIACGPEDSARVDLDREATGYGSSATWRSKVSTSTRAPVPEPRRPRPEVGEETELARYQISSGERVLLAQRVDGVVRLVDRPASGQGRSYLVERELDLDGDDALTALIADYRHQSQIHDRVPMLTATVGSQL